MSDFLSTVQSACDDFRKVAELAGAALSDGQMRIEFLPPPHKPPSVIPPGRVAVYIFAFGDRCLKVGKVNENSHARYVSQHYNPNSAPSTLARSILSDKERLCSTHPMPAEVGHWIKANCSRINVLLDRRFGGSVLSLLEAFLHCRLKPRYEG